MRLLLAFQKGEALRHLGHLDLQRLMQRALRRSGLPVRYSQGFHPHMLTSFASALSMGVSSEQEILDVALTEPLDEAECLARINAVLPPDLRASEAVLVEDEHPALMGLLKQASYVAWAPATHIDAFRRGAQAFLAQTEVMALRKSKRGERMVDIRPMLHALAIEESGGEMRLIMRLALEETATLKPDLLIETIAALGGIAAGESPAFRLRRTGLFGVAEGQAIPLLRM